MPVSLSKVLISFSFCDWFKRNAERWVAQPGLFAKCHDHVALYIRHLCYFSEIVFFIALLFSVRALFHSAFIFLSKCFIIALLFLSKRFVIALLFLSKRFIIALLFNFSKCKQVLIFYSGCKPALIFYSSKYETVSNFCFKTISNHISSLFFGLFLNMFQMLVLIMYKTSRFWPLV